MFFANLLQLLGRFFFRRWFRDRCIAAVSRSYNVTVGRAGFLLHVCLGHNSNRQIAFGQRILSARAIVAWRKHTKLSKIFGFLSEPFRFFGATSSLTGSLLCATQCLSLSL